MLIGREILDIRLSNYYNKIIIIRKGEHLVRK